MCPDADNPASVFTSIGKNVTSATTAAFDGQSKPNHITMIGATPTSGNAEKKLPSGSRRRRGRGGESCSPQRAAPSRPESTTAQKPAEAEPATVGSRSNSSVVAAPHRTPARPNVIARDPPVQAAAANSSAAASVSANSIG